MDSDRVSRARSYLGATRENEVLRLRGFHPLWHDFPDNFD